jgi:hypothetical protein
MSGDAAAARPIDSAIEEGLNAPNQRQLFYDGGCCVSRARRNGRQRGAFF